MNKIKMMREAMKSLSSCEIASPDDLTAALNDFLQKFHLPTVKPTYPDRDNRAEPAFDILDFDEVSSHFDD